MVDIISKFRLFLNLSLVNKLYLLKSVIYNNLHYIKRIKYNNLLQNPSKFKNYSRKKIKIDYIFPNNLSKFLFSTDLFFFSNLKNRLEIIKLIESKFPKYKEKIIEIAHEILNNEFRIFEKKIYFTNILDWNYSFSNKKSWPKKKSSKINSQPSINKLDIKSNWEFNRHNFLIILGISFYITNDEKYAKKIISLMYDWIKSNPIGYNTSWMDGLEVSMRLIAWIYSVNFIKDYLLRHSTFFFKIYKSMLYHFFYIQTNFEKYAGNHTIGQLFAIYLFSKFSSSIEFFKNIYNKTRKKFLFYVNQQINSDGMHFEFSINYHRFVLEFCLIFNLLEKKYLKNSHLKLFNKMLDILIFSINSENEIIQVGDSDDANAIPKAFFNFYDSNYFLELVSFGSFVLGRTFLNNFLKKNSPSLIFFFGKNGIKKFYEISENQNIELNKNYLYLEKTGYFFVRNGFKPKSNYLFFDMADFGLYGGHDHLDISNIIYSYHGNSILVDSGTYRYNVPLEIRNLYKGLKAHNVVEINDYKNSFSIGTYHWNNKPKILSREFLLNKGYKLKIKYKLYKNFEISREINANHNLDNLEIIDKIMNKNRKSIQKEIKIFLHFSKNNELHIENNQIICNNQLKLYFNINDQITPNLIKGSYMQSKNYGQFQRSPLIIISFKYNFKPKKQFTFKINIATLK